MSADRTTYKRAAGLIWRWDRIGVADEAEMLFWERNLLPFGWSIIADFRRAA